MTQARPPRRAATSRPGASPAARRTRPRATSTKTAGDGAAAASPAPPRRHTLTGRGAVLLLVVAALVLSLALPLRAYVQQRGQIADLRAEVDATRAEVDQLEDDKARWDDPAYVRAEARNRLFFVMPGETPYSVIDEGTAEQPGLGEAPPADAEVEDAWFETLWGSVQAADGP